MIRYFNFFVCKVTAKMLQNVQQKARKVVQNLPKCTILTDFQPFSPFLNRNYRELDIYLPLSIRRRKSCCLFLSGEVFGGCDAIEPLEGSAECTLIFVAATQGNV